MDAQTFHMPKHLHATDDLPGFVSEKLRATPTLHKSPDLERRFLNRVVADSDVCTLHFALQAAAFKVQSTDAVPNTALDHCSAAKIVAMLDRQVDR